MSRIKELRASFDKNLDALEHQALDAQLTQTKAQARERLEQRKQQLRDLLKQVRAEIQKSKEIAEQEGAEVQAKLEHLQVQLALGKAEAREAFEEQRTKILKAVSEFESIADEKLKGAAFESGKLWEDLVGRASTLEAEFEALKNRFECEERKGVGNLFSRATAIFASLPACPAMRCSSHITCTVLQAR
jgi:seryl-tRNA synthetase